MIEETIVPTIIHQLKRHGKWTGRRNNAVIRFWKRITEQGLRVYWQCHPQYGLQISGSASSVKEAVKHCNNALEERAEKRPPVIPPAPAKPVPGLPVRNEWLPYKDAEL